MSFVVQLCKAACALRCMTSLFFVTCSEITNVAEHIVGLGFLHSKEQIAPLEMVHRLFNGWLFYLRKFGENAEETCIKLASLSRSSIVVTHQ